MNITHQPSLVDLAQILFASPLQPLDRPTVAQVRGTVSRALNECGGDCSRYAGCVAQEAGDHPELYQRRMRWALATIGEVYQPAYTCAGPDNAVGGAARPSHSPARVRTAAASSPELCAA